MFEPVFMRLALVASIATGVSLGVMGVYLVIRRVVFLGLVVANAATLGAAVAQAVGWPPELTSLAAAVGAAVALGGVETSSRVSPESLMGWAYAAASSATVLVLSWVAGGSADTFHLLFGNVLAVQTTDVVELTIVAVVIGVIQMLFARRFLLVTFDPEAARVAGVNTRLWSLALNLAIGVAAAIAVGAIGALSTFALLTLPAMAALLATSSVRATFVTAAALSVVLPSCGLALSFYLDVPAGPASVALLAVSVPLAAMRNRGFPRSSFFGLIVLGSLLAGTASISAAQPQASDPEMIRAEIDRLRREFDALRQQYDDRLTVLEGRLTTLEGADARLTTTQPSQTQPPATEPAAPVPPGAAGAGGPEGALPVYGNVNALSKIFNPDVAVIGNVLGAAGTNTVDPLPALGLRETETSLQAIVDPYARADFFFAVSPDGIEVEEGYITFPTLPGGLLMKAGKLRSAFGKVNAMHTHVLPWADRPLVTRNLLGGDEGISDAGVSVARLLPNPWIFLEATGEVYRGESAVFRARQRGDLTYVGHLRGYQDITESTNLDFGASFAYGHNGAGPSATTRIVGFDGTFRYRPLRRAIYRRLLARTELIWSRRTEAHGLNAFGAYLGGDYQFARRWFGGLRYDHAGRATDPQAKDKGTSWLVTYWPSEFSQIRGQYRRTRYAEGRTANEVLLQLLFSIGAHGAHAF